MRTSYPFKVWITSHLSGSLFLWLAVWLETGSGFHPAILVLYFYFVVSGAVISLPTLFLFNLACREFVHFRLPQRVIKLLLALVAIGCTWFTLYLIVGKRLFSTKEEFGIFIPLCYSGCILLSAFVYPLKSPRVNRKGRYEVSLRCCPPSLIGGSGLNVPASGKSPLADL